MVEIVARQHDDQVSRAIDDTDPELAQRGRKLGRAGGAARLGAHADLAEVLCGYFRGKPEACPVARDRAVDGAWGEDEAAIEEALQRPLDLGGGKFAGERANNGGTVLTRANPLDECVIQLAVKEEFPVLRGTPCREAAHRRRDSAGTGGHLRFATPTRRCGHPQSKPTHSGSLSALPLFRIRELCEPIHHFKASSR